MNWKSLVEKENARTFVLPPGWDSRETVAEQLECSPEKVDDHLRPALRSGKVQKQQFKVWDKNLKRNVMVIAYSADSTLAQVQGADTNVRRMRELKEQGKSYAEIGAIVGLSGDAVRGKLRRVA